MSTWFTASTPPLISIVILREIRMKLILPQYPNITKFLSAIGHEDTFLHDRISNPNYGFWPHLEYFLLNAYRFKNHETIIERLLLEVPLNMEINKAWAKWQKFRSAQSEITVIYINEMYFSGQVVEIVPVDKKPTPDIKVILHNCEHLIEIKAQSGQQHGSKHPRAKGCNSFTPQDELDLKSWLFHEKISSRNDKPMEPKTLEADKKGADILVAMTDYFHTGTDIKNEASKICPGSKYLESKNVKDNEDKPLIVHFFESAYPISKDLKNLKEIWLFDESHLDRFMVLSREAILLEHLKNTR